MLQFKPHGISLPLVTFGSIAGLEVGTEAQFPDGGMGIVTPSDTNPYGGSATGAYNWVIVSAFPPPRYARTCRTSVNSASKAPGTTSTSCTNKCARS